MIGVLFWVVAIVGIVALICLDEIGDKIHDRRVKASHFYDQDAR
jgi:uncharacterized membrane protein